MSKQVVVCGRTTSHAAHPLDGIKGGQCPGVGDAEATEYVRELDDAQLVGLLVDIQQRIAALPPEVQRLLPMQQIENHHLLGLLEVLVGPEKSMSVREWHLTWVDRQLDVVEAQVRMQMLADLPGFP